MTMQMEYRPVCDERASSDCYIKADTTFRTRQSAINWMASEYWVVKGDGTYACPPCAYKKGLYDDQP